MTDVANNVINHEFFLRPDDITVGINDSSYNGPLNSSVDNVHIHLDDETIEMQELKFHDDMDIISFDDFSIESDSTFVALNRVNRKFHDFKNAFHKKMAGLLTYQRSFVDPTMYDIKSSMQHRIVDIKNAVSALEDDYSSRSADVTATWNELIASYHAEEEETKLQLQEAEEQFQKIKEEQTVKYEETKRALKSESNNLDESQIQEKLNEIETDYANLMQKTSNKLTDVQKNMQSKMQDCLELLETKVNEYALQLEEYDNMLTTEYHIVASDEASIQNKITHLDHFKLCNLDQVPQFMCASPYVETGYRVYFSKLLCLKSIFFFHNETGNIWTHLLGTIIFLLALIEVWIRYLNPRSKDRMIGEFEIGDSIAVSLWIITAIQCVASSTIFHIFHCHSPDVYHKTHVCDLIGIVSLISGSFCPIIYLGFCSWTPIIIYLSCALISNILILKVLSDPKYHTHSYRTRVILFLFLFGFSYAIPTFHIIFGNPWSVIAHVFRLLMEEVGTYISGAILYALHIPDRWISPKSKLMYFMGSHPIWHCFVVIAAMQHFWLLEVFIDIRATHPELCHSS